MAHRADDTSILVEAVRAACLDAAVLAYEDAGIRGLCADGRWEAAVAAIRQLDLSHMLERNRAGRDHQRRADEASLTDGMSRGPRRQDHES
jgi:hypothetical protein